jgi:hypothetical protein
MAQQPPVNTGLRLPPSTKAQVRALLDALRDEGETVKQDDLFGALIHRARSVVGNTKALARLGEELRAQRARARSEGF